MSKIVFLKNNQEILMSNEKIDYFQESLTIIKKNEESKITLNFQEQTCHLEMKDISLDIPVLKMSYEIGDLKDVFTFTLVSEPDVINTVIIHKK